MSVTYRPYLPTTREIRDIVGSEIGELGGTISDCFDDGERLYLRTVLPRPAEVRRGDTVRGGVAVRAVGPEISVHPYTLRQVCTNGAVVAQALQSRCVERVDLAAPTPYIERVVWELTEAVRACAAPEAFDAAVAEMRSAADRRADHLINVLPMLSRLSGGGGRDSLVRLVLRQFAEEGDRSAFGLMNAVTAVARETRDPETRWRLEELGAAVPAHLTRPRPTRPAAVEQAAFAAPAPTDRQLAGALAGGSEDVP